MTDQEIIQLFISRSERGISEISAKYNKICTHISFNILNNKADAEECVNDAYLGVWNSVPPTEPNPLLTYLCKIVRNISLKKYYKSTAKKRNSQFDLAIDELENYIPDKNTVEQQAETRELTVIIESFLDSLSAENRVVFMRRYWFGDSYQDISERVGISSKNVSVRLARVRNLLKEHLKEREVL